MKSEIRVWTAFMKKEWMEQLRTFRFFVVGALFVLLGIMNPDAAKMTPWLLEVLAGSLSENGIAVGAVSVDAMTSWMQFFKNIPMGLIVFLLLESGIFTREYQTQTLVLVLAKGVARYRVVLSKAAVLLALWSACYLTCFAVTYGYNAYFWDNSAAAGLAPAIFCWWLFGVWTLMTAVLFSAVMSASTGVSVGTGAAVLAAYLISLLPRVGAYSPCTLIRSEILTGGFGAVESLPVSIAATTVFCVLSAGASIIIMNKRAL